MMSFSFGSIKQQAKIAAAELQTVETDWHRGAVKDPVDVIIRIEKIRLSKDEGAAPELLWMISPFGLLVTFPLLGYVYVYFSPPYNFLWGDRIAIYEKRRSRGRFLLIGIALTILLGVVANFVSKRIGF